MPTLTGCSVCLKCALAITPDRAVPFQGQERQCDQPGVEENPYG
jgi:hypothetical protein